MTSTAQQFVQEHFPTARVCIETDYRGRIKDELVIGIGLNTVIGRGKTASKAWRDAALTVAKEKN